MSFSQPSRSDVHVDTPLTNVSLAFLQGADGFVADRAFPRVPVQKQSDVFYTYDRGYFNRVEMEKRGDTAESAGMNYAISTDSYDCDVWSLHKDISDRVRANADSPIQLDREATEVLTLQSLLRREVEWSSTFFTTSQWTTDITGVSGAPGASQVQQWNEAASTPIEDIRDYKRTVQASTGFRPNKLIVGRAAFDALLDHPDIVGRLDRGQTAGPAMAMRESLSALFELDEILVMDAIQNTANEGAANAHSFIGGNHALLVYSPQSPGLMTPAAGYTFTWTGLLGGGALGTNISRYRHDLRKSDRLEIEAAWAQKLVAADLGVFFSGVVA